MNKEAIWRILVEECVADPEIDQSFLYHWPKCQEFRFIGALGFGGKVWHRAYADLGEQITVSCYGEDRTPERLAMIERANTRFKEMQEQTSEYRRMTE